MHHDEPTIAALQAEVQSLRSRLEVYQSIVNNLQVGVVLYHLDDPANDLSLRVVDLNPASSVQVGGDATDWIGKTIDYVIPHEPNHETASAYANVVRTNTPLHFEYVMDAPEQGQGAFDVNAIPLPDDHMAIVFANVTERRQAEQALRERETQISTVLSHAPLILFAFGPDGVVTVAEGRALEEIGLRSEHLVGQSMYDLYQGQPSILAAVRRAIGGAISTSEVEINGTFFESRYTPVLEDGQVVRVIGVGMDVTARRQAEEALRQSLAQEEVINAQAAALRELSTPLIPLADQIVVMPLVGNLDSSRTQQVMETLLEGIVEHQAGIAILDITGVPVVDTQVADSLLRTARAVKLLGAQVVLTGIASGVAQSLVHLGADLGDIVTLSNLQSGINYALEHV